MDSLSRLDPVEVKGGAPEEPSIDINQVHLKLPAIKNRNHPELKSVQSLDKYYIDILSNQVRESIVNAVWNQLLREVFQYPDFVLAPEYYTTNNQRVDLVPCGRTFKAQNPLVPVFAYEGKKGPIGDAEWLQAIEQAAGYLPYIYRLKNGRYYGMVCAGRGVIILEFMPGGGHNQVLQVVGPNLLTDVTYNYQIWDIHFQAEKIDIILGAILQEVYKS